MLTIEEIWFLAGVCWTIAGALIVYAIIFPDDCL